MGERIVGLGAKTVVVGESRTLLGSWLKAVPSTLYTRGESDSSGISDATTKIYLIPNNFLQQRPNYLHGQSKKSHK